MHPARTGGPYASGTHYLSPRDTHHGALLRRCVWARHGKQLSSYLALRKQCARCMRALYCGLACVRKRSIACEKQIEN